MGRHLTVVVTVVALAFVASSASAAVIDPPKWDFGGVVIGKTSKPVVFTVTRGGESESELRGDDITGGFVIGYGCLCLSELQAPQGDCLTVAVLTPSAPKCTITVVFEPEFPGIGKGVVFTNYRGSGAIAKIHGTGLLASNNYFCRKKNGKYVSKPKITKYCVRKGGRKGRRSDG